MQNDISMLTLNFMSGTKKFFYQQELKKMSSSWSVICQMKLKRLLMLTEIFGLKGPMSEST